MWPVRTPAPQVWLRNDTVHLCSHFIGQAGHGGQGAPPNFKGGVGDKRSSTSGSRREAGTAKTECHYLRWGGPSQVRGCEGRTEPRVAERCPRRDGRWRERPAGPGALACKPGGWSSVKAGQGWVVLCHGGAVEGPFRTSWGRKEPPALRAEPEEAKASKSLRQLITKQLFSEKVLGAGSWAVLRVFSWVVGCAERFIREVPPGQSNVGRRIEVKSRLGPHPPPPYAVQGPRAA